MQKTVSVKLLAVFMTMILVVGGVIGGTVAWLIAETNPVVNTFTFGDISIELEETKVDIDGNPVDGDDEDTDPDKITGADDQNEYKLIPGVEYLKDPTVTVEAESEKCWLFVTVTENIAFVEGAVEGSFETYLTYAVDTEVWKALTPKENGTQVYYTVVEYDAENDQIFNVLKDKKVSVSEDLTKEQIEILDGNPTLTFQAYAVQYSGFEPAEGETE